MRPRQPPAGLPAHPIGWQGAIPVLGAQISPSGHCWNVWCCWCRSIHSHGPDPGHRVDHCFQPESPYRDTGYYIELVDAPAA